jgi:hypothetical protein
MSEELIGGGLLTLVAGAIGWFLKSLFQHDLRERIARLESDLHTQSQWLAARLTRTDERRARILSGLHTALDTALHFTEDYIGSCDAGNSDKTLNESRRRAFRSWLMFQHAFESAEIFLSEELAQKIRSYGDRIADIRVQYDLERDAVPEGADLPTTLHPASKALGELSKLRSDVRPQLVREIRAALGANALDRRQ